MPTPELVARFSLGGVSRTNAVFDRAKLEWYNGHYLQKMPIDELLPHVEAQLRVAKIWRDEWGGDLRFNKQRDVGTYRTGGVTTVRYQ